MATYDRRLGLDAKTKTRGTRIIERALRDRPYLTRLELRERLAGAKMPLDTTRLAHLCLYAELERIVCSGPRRGRQSTYALFDERVQAAPRRPRDEALAELARRFLQSHGPATIRDFVWWSGLGTPDAKRAIEMIDAQKEEIAGKTYYSHIRRGPGLRPDAGRRSGPARRGPLLEGAAHLLPVYDEYLVAYRDRLAVPHLPVPMMSFRPGSPFAFPHPLVVGGQVAGTWRVVARARSLAIEVVAARRFTTLEKGDLDEAAGSYGRFVAAPVTLSIATGRR
jgi:hypothetical protein